MATRKGILGEKLGMTQIFDAETARAVPVTVLRTSPCRVAQVRSPETDGYSAVQLAFGEVRPGRINKPEQGHLDAAGVQSARTLAEVRTDDAAEYSLGQEITCSIFGPGDRVDVTATSKGKGFSGAMKRHNFKGLSASHGTHRVHRSPGAIGACATPARVFKGTRMAGQYGNARVTTLNLEVVEADAERGLLMVKGAVPGPAGGVVLVRSGVKSRKQAGAANG
ncbi:MAG: 50S ribosomal protein L3 [Acidobacteria bacterium]|nr:MAG: 50S ribosomal protein L3 [Acidobacteriota bacterium]